MASSQSRAGDPLTKGPPLTRDPLQFEYAQLPHEKVTAVGLKVQEAVKFAKIVRQRKGLNVDKAARAVGHWLKIPSPCSRNGLRALYLGYHEVGPKLRLAYSSLSSYPDWSVRVCILAVACKMSADSLLCERMLSDDPDIVEKAVSLLPFAPATRMALSLIKNLTKQGQNNVPHNLLSPAHLQALAASVHRHPQDAVAGDLISAIFADCLAPVPPVHELGLGGAVGIIRAVVVCMTCPKALANCVADGVRVVSALLGPYSPKDWRDGILQHCPEIGHLLAAGIRSPTWECRAVCLHTLLSVYGVYGISETVPEVSVLDEISPFPNSTLPGLAAKLTSPRLIAAMTNYREGWTRCTSYVAAVAPWQLVKALQDFSHNNNAIALGLTLYNLVLSTEFAIVQNTEAGAAPGCPPFLAYADALQFCAKAFRSRGLPKDDIRADVLDIAFKLKKNLWADAFFHVAEAIQLQPRVAYFRYVFLLLAPYADPYSASLDALDAGRLRDETATLYIRTSILARGIERQALAGLDKMLELSYQSEEQPCWALAFKYFAGVVGDSVVFLNDASPCHLERGRVFGWLTIAQLVFSTQITSCSWSKFLKNAQEKHLGPYLDFCQALEMDPYHWPAARLLSFLLNSFLGAVTRYGFVFWPLGDGNLLVGPDLTNGEALVREADEHERSKRATACEREKFQKLLEQDCDALASNDNARVPSNNILLYLCSSCDRPSANHRRCSACKAVRSAHALRTRGAETHHPGVANGKLRTVITLDNLLAILHLFVLCLRLEKDPLRRIWLRACCFEPLAFLLCSERYEQLQSGQGLSTRENKVAIESRAVARRIARPLFLLPPPSHPVVSLKMARGLQKWTLFAFMVLTSPSTTISAPAHVDSVLEWPRSAQSKLPHAY
ncbi:hypothetical protein NMY22_g5280 [Coprinellus aureogranulatus]|nr:hypothetical protein NMY22_g5280 [Coprinellus aureogranulatus]